MWPWFRSSPVAALRLRIRPSTLNRLSGYRPRLIPNHIHARNRVQHQHLVVALDMLTLGNSLYASKPGFVCTMSNKKRVGTLVS